MRERNSGNPHVILGNWAALGPKPVANSRVLTGNGEIARQHSSAADEALDSGKVLRCSPGVHGTVNQLAGDRDGD